MKDNKAVASDARVGVDKKPFVRLTRTGLLSVEDYSIRHAASLGSLVQTTAVPSVSKTASTSPITLDPTQHLLVLLIDFSNVQIKQSDAYWSQKFFGPSSSVDDYYNEVSQGKMTFAPVSETSGAAADDGVLRATLPTQHPAVNGYENTDEMYDRILSTVETALEMEAPDITGLSSYDTDQDGVLESDELHIVTIFAGYEASASGEANPLNAIWAHEHQRGIPVDCVDRTDSNGGGEHFVHLDDYLSSRHHVGFKLSEIEVGIGLGDRHSSGAYSMHSWILWKDCLHLCHYRADQWYLWRDHRHRLLLHFQGRL